METTNTRPNRFDFSPIRGKIAQTARIFNGEVYRRESSDVTIIEPNSGNYDGGKAPCASVPLAALVQRYAPYFTRDASVYVITPDTQYPTRN